MRDQKIQYIQLTSVKKSLISDERIPKLEKLGFKWNSDNQLSDIIAWNERFSDLREFKQGWDNCDVPQKCA